MSSKMPTRLSSEPLVEVICEVRFDAPGDAAVNLLPGIFHEKFGPFENQNRLFPGSLPMEFFAADKSLALRPQLMLGSGNCVIQIGANTVSVAVRAPYPGWQEFRDYVCRVFNTVHRQSFITSFNWLSLKYVDVIRNDETPRISWLNVDVQLAGRKLDTESHSLRAEYEESPWTTITQIVCPVELLEVAGKGLLVDVDVIYRQGFDDFANEYVGVLDELHARNKAQFFSLLSESTLNNLGPEYK